MLFKITKKSKKSKARRGIISTPHGNIETPAFIPVGTQATVKGMTVEQLQAISVQAVLCNTYHLYLRPGDKTIKKLGGLHRFMNWPKPIFTDSGGFQVFSLGLGKKHGVGKIIKETDKPSSDRKMVYRTGGESLVKITEEGVAFRSHLDGSRHFLTPEKSIQIQKNLGADIIFAFDECTSPLSPYAYQKKAMERTHRWAERSLKEFQKSKGNSQKSKIKDQVLFGIVQGGEHQDLRQASARYISVLDFDGFGIGGSFGNTIDKKFTKVLDWVTDILLEEKPRHLLGIGGVNDIYQAVERGIDTFDCVMPTRLGRNGTALTKRGAVNIKASRFLSDKKPIDSYCQCYTCQHHTRAYLAHLFRANEMLGSTLATIHNLFFMEELMKNIREKI